MNTVNNNAAPAVSATIEGDYDVMELMNFVVPFWSKKLQLPPASLFTISDQELYDRIEHAYQNNWSEEEAQLLDEYHAFKKTKVTQDQAQNERDRLKAGGIPQNEAFVQQNDNSYFDDQNKFSYEKPGQLNTSADYLYRHEAAAGYGQGNQTATDESAFTASYPYEQYVDDRNMDSAQFNSTMYENAPNNNVETNEYNDALNMPSDFQREQVNSRLVRVLNRNEQSQLMQKIQALEKERDELKALYFDTVDKHNATYNVNMSPEQIVNYSLPKNFNNGKLCEVVNACKRLKDVRDALNKNCPTGDDHVIQQILQKATHGIDGLYSLCKARLNYWLMNHPLWSGVLDELAMDMGANLDPIAKVLKCKK